MDMALTVIDKALSVVALLHVYTVDSDAIERGMADTIGVIVMGGVS